MAYEPTEDGGDSDLRRRAAWLLLMLVVVAVLIVVVFTTVLNTDNGSGGDSGAGTGPGAITSTGPPSPTPTPTGARRTQPSTSTSSRPSTATSTTASGSAGCPTSSPCALDSDVGGAIPAINAFRAKQGKSAIPGSVSKAATTCALNRGSGCSGGWAETEIPAPADGTLAVQKISQFAKLTDPQMKSIEVGWAFDPSSKTYYFATIRKD